MLLKVTPQSCTPNRIAMEQEGLASVPFCAVGPNLSMILRV